MPVMVLIGILYAPYHNRTAKSPLRSRGAMASYLLAGIFLLLVVLSYMLAPDWMWMYFMDSHQVSLPGIIYVLFALYLVPLIAGILFGNQLFAASKGWWLTSILLCLLMEGLLLVFLWQRYNLITNYEGFLRGEGEPLLGSTHPLAILLNLGGIILIIMGIYLWVKLKAGVH